MSLCNEFVCDWIICDKLFAWLSALPPPLAFRAEVRCPWRDARDVSCRPLIANNLEIHSHSLSPDLHPILPGPTLPTEAATFLERGRQGFGVRHGAGQEHALGVGIRLISNNHLVDVLHVTQLDQFFVDLKKHQIEEEPLFCNGGGKRLDHCGFFHINWIMLGILRMEKNGISEGRK